MKCIKKKLKKYIFANINFGILKFLSTGISLKYVGFFLFLFFSTKVKKTCYFGQCCHNFCYLCTKTLIRPVTDLEWRVTNFEWPVTEDEWPLTDQELPITVHEWPVTDHKWPETDREWPVTNHEWPVMDCGWPITDHEWP